MRMHTTVESAPGQSHGQAATTRHPPQALQRKQASEWMNASPGARTLQRYQHLADNSAQAQQFRQRTDLLAASASMRQLEIQRKIGSVIQRVVKWWPTDAGHTTVTGGPADQPPGGAYVKREKAGASDELVSTEDQAWARAKNFSLQHRPENTALFPKTTEKMETHDGNRTYLIQAGTKKTVSILVTHTTDPQSQVQTEQGVNLKVIHAHSGSGNYQQVIKAFEQGKTPAYQNTDEAAVHFLSLSLQPGEAGSGNTDDKSGSEPDIDDDASSTTIATAGKEERSGTAPAIVLGPNELLFANLAGYRNPSMLLDWRDSASYAKYKEAIDTYPAPMPMDVRDELIAWIKRNRVV